MTGLTLASLPYPQAEEGAESSKLLIKAWSLWRPAPILKLSQGLIKTEYAPVILITQEIPRVLRSSGPGTGDKDHISL